MIAGRALVQTVRHFFPQFNQWLDRLPDTRVADACTYDARFLAWWGFHLYLLQLGARRQLDYELRDGGPHVLANLNRLAETRQTTLPVHDTLDHFVGHVALSGWERLRTQMVQRLLRMKALDAARLLGRPVLLIDATGLLCFQQRHCPHCLVQRHGNKMLYLHHVLEAKLLGPEGVVLSLGSEFIENADAGVTTGRSAEEIKQDCELTALQRLAPRIKNDYPQAHFVLALDSLYACGAVFALADRLKWSVVATFKEGRTPALWQEFQALLPACPANALTQTWGESLIGYVGIGAINSIVAFGSTVVLLVSIAATAQMHAPWLLGFSIVGWLAFIVAWSYLMNVASLVYKGALFLYAAEGTIAEPYEQEMLDSAWKFKK